MLHLSVRAVCYCRLTLRPQQNIFLSCDVARPWQNAATNIVARHMDTKMFLKIFRNSFCVQGTHELHVWYKSTTGKHDHVSNVPATMCPRFAGSWLRPVHMNTRLPVAMCTIIHIWHKSRTQTVIIRYCTLETFALQDPESWPWRRKGRILQKASSTVPYWGHTVLLKSNWLPRLNPYFMDWVL